jgi:hypothetical protein
LLCGWAKLENYFLNVKSGSSKFLFICMLFYTTSLFACCACVCASFVVYASAHIRINSLYHFSLYENICLFYKTS